MATLTGCGLRFSSEKSRAARCQSSTQPETNKKPSCR